MKKGRRGHKLTALLSIIALFTAPSLAMKECEGVTFAPVEMVVTRAHDQTAMFGDTRSHEKLGMVDIHAFNHFYTYQVDRDVNEHNEGVVMDLVKEYE